MGKKSTPPAPVEGGKLALVACHFNPAGYVRPVENLGAFIAGIQEKGWLKDAFIGVCSFPNQEPLAVHTLDKINILHLRSGSILWQKEALLNAVVAQLPPEYTKVAILDADVLLPDGWYEATSAALDTYPIIQPWSRAIIEEECRPSVGKGASLRDKRASNWGCYHPGYAWAMRRDFFTTGPGLYQNAIVGLADGLLALATTDSVVSTHRQITALSDVCQNDIAGWIKAVRDWHGKNRLSCIKADIEVLTHGETKNRRYYEILELLRDFDPATDLVPQTVSGPLEWSESAKADKAQMIWSIGQYFDGRLEDGPPVLTDETEESAGVDPVADTPTQLDTDETT